MAVPLVSVLIPCYNAERWVREAVESALNQTHPRIEVVVVDDGSSDSSVELLRSFGGSIILETGPNRGGCAARNRAFALSAGEYVQYLDADDYLLPEKIERQVRFLKEMKADVVYGDWRERQELPGGKNALGPVTISGGRDDVLGSLLGAWWVANMALLFRREVVHQCGGWDETLKAAQDRDFFTAVALTGAAIQYQPGCYSIYRRYGDVTVSTGNRPRWLESHLRVVEKAECALLGAGKLSPTYRRALARSFFSLARNYYLLDRDRYRRLLQKVLALDPDFRPQGSLPYRLVQRFFGFGPAERLASVKRRLTGSFRSATC